MNQKPLKFENLLWNFLSSGSGEYSSEIQKYVPDLELSLPEEKGRLDVWWNKVFKTNRYTVLSSLVCPCLSIFMEQMVEWSLSMKNHILDSRSGCMEIQTCSIIRTPNDCLKCNNSAALKYRKKIYCETLQIQQSHIVCIYLHHIKNVWKLNKKKWHGRKNFFKSNKAKKKVNCAQAGF